jgi:hypothetical protein
MPQHHADTEYRRRPDQPVRCRPARFLPAHSAVLICCVAASGRLHRGVRRIGWSDAPGADAPKSSDGSTNIALMGLDRRTDHHGEDLPPEMLKKLPAGSADTGGYDAPATIPPPPPTTPENTDSLQGSARWAGHPEEHPVNPNLIFGGVYGTVLASALLAALHSEGDVYVPYQNAAWIMMTAVTSALAHGYAHHMTSDQHDADSHRWNRLARTLLGEWPLIAGCLPTVLLLVAAGMSDWPEPTVTATGLTLNTALLLVWGVASARRLGYRRRSTLLFGFADATLGVLIAMANAVIK